MQPTKTVIITGGNRGLGYQTSLALAHAGWHVVIASRSPQRNQAAVEQLREESNRQHITALTLDLASLRSVRNFVEVFTAQDLPPLHAVVCNAGVQISSGLQFTEDGYEMTFGVNHLGHFLLVNLLIEQIMTPARIVVVSSGTHIPNHRLARLLQVPPPRFSNAHDLAKPAAPEEASSLIEGAWRYSTSKLCNVLFAYELDRRLKANSRSTAAAPINVYTIDPGLMPGTGLAREAHPAVQWLFSRMVHAARPFVAGIRTPQQSAQDVLRLLTDPVLIAKSGSYYDGRHEVRSSAESYDSAKAQQFWGDSADLAGIQADAMALQRATTGLA